MLVFEFNRLHTPSNWLTQLIRGHDKDAKIELKGEKSRRILCPLIRVEKTASDPVERWIDWYFLHQPSRTTRYSAQPVKLRKDLHCIRTFPVHDSPFAGELFSEELSIKKVQTHHCSKRSFYSAQSYVHSDRSCCLIWLCFESVIWQ